MCPSLDKAKYSHIIYIKKKFKNKVISTVLVLRRLLVFRMRRTCVWCSHVGRYHKTDGVWFIDGGLAFDQRDEAAANTGRLGDRICQVPAVSGIQIVSLLTT